MEDRLIPLCLNGETEGNNKQVSWNTDLSLSVAKFLSHVIKIVYKCILSYNNIEDTAPYVLSKS